MTEYKISSSEIDRRMVAFTDLLIALFFGLFAGIVAFVPRSLTTNLTVFVLVTLAYIMLIFLLHHVVNRFFASYSKTEVVLAKDYLKRSTMHSIDKIYYRDIKSIKVLWTTRKLVRDIVITTKGGMVYTMDGLAEFENLKKELEERSKIKAVEAREPADFDHRLFYPLLGTALGVGTVYFAKFLAGLTIDQSRVANKMLSIYLFALGIYFLVARPFAKRYGMKLSKNDYVYALVTILASIVLLNLL